MGILRRLWKNRRGETEKIVAMVIALILVAVLIPVAFTQIASANQTGWAASVVSLWGLIPVIAIIGIFLLVLKVAGVL